LDKGKLFGCTTDKSDFIVVFCRGFLDSNKIRQSISSHTGISDDRIWVLRKMGEENDEILMLLRNPYGNSLDAYLKKGTLENRLHQVITLALKHINDNTQDLFYQGKEGEGSGKDKDNESIKLTIESKEALNQFFFGKDGFEKDNFGKTEGFAFELRKALMKLEAGNEPPLFLHPLRIFNKSGTAWIKDGSKTDGIKMDEKEILELIDKRVEEKLREKGL
jgi:hypothetical protein